MSKIKKFFITSLGIIFTIFYKVSGVYADVEIPKVPALYGVPQPEPATEFASILGKIALFVLLPLLAVAMIVVGIIALVKTNKKKKQAVNIDQNITNNVNNNNEKV